ncbi:hypothetical protein [Pseudozobellia sp. WGM2]|uniref:hypothetical protein n=1 Tax=Pseudozobellia sp. WGM2 TaxID=2787625 RepID=UPI001ADFA27E|nr:hypothetical protein [Pseudozobellia sp. WGM2]
MAKLTSEQLKILADNMLRMANALGDYRYENIDQLSKAENDTIKALHEQTLNSVTELYTKSTVLSIDDVQENLERITIITAKTQKLYKSFTTVQNVIDRATSVLKIAAAVISLDTEKITESIKNLLT